MITAPAVAEIKVPSKPSPKLIPIKEKTQLPKREPAIPRIKLTSHPKPVPFTKYPAIKPANMPIIITPIILI